MTIEKFNIYVFQRFHILIIHYDFKANFFSFTLSIALNTQN